MEPQNVIDILKEKIKPLLSDLDAEIVEITLKKASNKHILHVLADKKGGITVGECVKIHKRLGAIIDQESFIQGQYLVEVSSPGLDRPLKEIKDFKRHEGEDIEVWLSQPLEEKNFISGNIEKAEEDNVTLKDKDGKEVAVLYNMITKAKLKI